MEYLLRQADFVKLNTADLAEIMAWHSWPAAEATALPFLAAHFNLQAVCLPEGAAGATLWADHQFVARAGTAAPRISAAAVLCWPVGHPASPPRALATGHRAYLACWRDDFSRRVVGWHVSKSLHTDLLLTAFSRAVAICQPRLGLLVHADRGS